MPQMFYVDQAATFTGVAFLQSAPKMAFGTREQDKTTDGLGKWEVQCVAGFRDQFGNPSHEVIKINVASHTDPGQGLNPYTPVQLVNFIVGVVPPEIRKNAQGQEKLVGGSTWYRADSIQSTAQPSGRQRPAAGE